MCVCHYNTFQAISGQRTAEPTTYIKEGTLSLQTSSTVTNSLLMEDYTMCCAHYTYMYNTCSLSSQALAIKLCTIKLCKGRKRVFNFLPPHDFIMQNTLNEKGLELRLIIITCTRAILSCTLLTLKNLLWIMWSTL